MKKKYFNVIFAVLVLVSVFLLSDKSMGVMKRIVLTGTTEKDKVIVIDAGHGEK